MPDAALERQKLICYRLVERNMARRVETCERTLFVGLPSGNSYCDIGFMLSRLNRKSFRQGMQYQIQNVELIGDLGTDIDLSVNRLSETWVMANAWEKAFRHWKEQQDEAMDITGSESRRAAWNDFKIYMSEEHFDFAVANGGIPSLLQTNSITEATAKTIDPTANTQWDYSNLVVPNDPTSGATTEYSMWMVGDDNAGKDGVGLIHNYALSRARPELFDPNQPAPSIDGGIFQDMVDVGEDLEEILSNVRTENFTPPYIMGDVDSSNVQEWYQGGANDILAGFTNQDILAVRSGSGSVTTDNSGPFLASCGLLWFFHENENPVFVKITVSAGYYKGVMARPMKDVN